MAMKYLMTLINNYKYIMNINAALEFLRNNNYIIESELHGDLDNLYKKHHDATDASYKNRVTAYEDDGRYSDAEGIKWTRIKKRDEFTMRLAYFDAICDTCRYGFKESDYEKIKTQEELKQVYENNNELNKRFGKSWSIC